MEKDTVKKLILDLVSGKISEEKQDEIYEKISQISPDPEWSDYIFVSFEFYDNQNNLNIDAVVEKIFSYKPILL